ncbi:hypothetical protein KUL72_14500 [Bradyrhizobium arachidis]|uniref:hypothetical protein n=1 Tax=Bradyrhizobium arachidis TaxID=858423 RepID=UPI00216280D1|nr:hypothetical protein [Bradyrhizobium arachidis]UVO39468.1 hypothetical protein KUL72_14500 [Bradyrhizobium arachidis]
MNEVHLAKPAAAPPPPPIAPAVNAAVNQNADVSVLLKDGRLEITATVDADGLKMLKQMLEKYEGILEILKSKQ